MWAGRRVEFEVGVFFRPRAAVSGSEVSYTARLGHSKQAGQCGGKSGSDRFAI